MVMTTETEQGILQKNKYDQKLNQYTKGAQDMMVRSHPYQPFCS